MNQMERVCPEIDVLAAWVEGSLPPTERPQVKAHLAGCDDCRRTAALAATLEPTEAVGAVDELFVQRLAAASRRRPLWPWAVAAGALLAVGAAVLAGRPPRVPETPREVVVEIPAPLPQTPIQVVPPPVPPVALIPKTVPAPPPPVVKDPGTPLVAIPTTPPPAPDPKPEPPKPDPVVAAVPPKPPVPVLPTETDLRTVFTPVFAVDPSGDLWLSREGAEAAKAGVFERVAFKDVFAAKAEAAAFTIEGRASVVLEKGAEAAVSWYRADEAYRLDLARGPAFVDTEGGIQKWLFTAGAARLAFPELHGKASVELRGEVLGVLLLEGKAVVESGGRRQNVEPGREVVLSAAGAVDVRKGASTADRLARLAKARPKTATVFAATFDERPDAVLPFPYTVLMGRVVPTPAGAHLEAARVTTDRVAVTAALKPERMIAACDGMVLRFRYRTNLGAFTVKLLEPQAGGKMDREYAVEVPVRARAMTWAEAELPLSGLLNEGVPMVSSTSVREIRLEGAGKNGNLEVDALHFMRRAR